MVNFPGVWCLSPRGDTIHLIISLFSALPAIKSLKTYAAEACLSEADEEGERKPGSVGWLLRKDMCGAVHGFVVLVAAPCLAAKMCRLRTGCSERV